MMMNEKKVEMSIDQLVQQAWTTLRDGDDALVYEDWDDALEYADDALHLYEQACEQGMTYDWDGDLMMAIRVLEVKAKNQMTD